MHSQFGPERRIESIPRLVEVVRAFYALDSERRELVFAMAKQAQDSDVSEWERDYALRFVHETLFGETD